MNTSLGLRLADVADALANAWWTLDAAGRLRLAGHVMLAWAEQRGDPDAEDQLRVDHPDLHEVLNEQPEVTLAQAYARYVRGLPPWAENNLPERLVAGLVARLSDERWAALGIDGWYPRLLRALDPAWSGRFLVENDTGPRLSLRTQAWRELLPGFQGWAVNDDLAEALQERGQPNPDLQDELLIEGKQKHHTVHLPLPDGLLLLDAFGIEELGQRLETDEHKVRVRRDENGRDLAYVPLACARKIRGLMAKLADDTPEALLARAQVRLKERGVERPDVWLLQLSAGPALVLPPAHARRLLIPVAPGDPAGRVSMRRLPFDPRARGYLAENGIMLLQAAELSYCDSETIRAYTAAWGFVDSNGQPTSQFFEFADLGAQAFAASSAADNTILVAFRGTDEPMDVIADALIDYVDGSIYGGGHVPRGFHRQFTALLPLLQRWLADYPVEGPSAPAIMATGHSMGGALAVLFTAWCLQNGLPIAQVYTAGQPRTGNQDFARLLEARLAEKDIAYYRYVNGYDAIPFTPPYFADAGREVYIDKDGRLWAPEQAAQARGDLSTLKRVWVNLADRFADHLNTAHLALLRKGRHFFEGEADE